MEAERRIREHVAALYGPERTEGICTDLEKRMSRMPPPPAAHRYRFGPADAVLITYGHSLQGAGEAPLRTLKVFADRYLAGLFNTIHILPFFPYTSDDGFSVVDYAQVDPELGTWADVAALGENFRLMFDFVLNHVSAQSDWVRHYLAGHAEFADLAIAVSPRCDLSAVARPRVTPLLTAFPYVDGTTRWLWTTFGPDQVDLNWANPAVMLRMVDVMLDYVRRGAVVLRLDAVAYLWKTVGTDCIHRPETHRVVKLLRAILDRVAPHVVILTETNVPHVENLSYLGDGRDEAQVVYNFTLPPLLLHTLLEADATVLSRWAAGLETPSPETTFLNFTASHDGIGLRPLEGILPLAAVDRLVDHALANGGRVSMRTGTDGQRQPYELNITYIDALRSADPSDPWHLARFMASQSIQYALPGVPATYIHSLLGSRNWQAGVEDSGQPRRINRQPLNADRVRRALADPTSFRHAVFNAYLRMVRIRCQQPAFSPSATMAILDLGPSVFAVRRQCASQSLWALTNVSSHRCQVQLTEAGGELVDLMDGSRVAATEIRLAPYQYRWLTEPTEGMFQEGKDRG
ncbi:MAG TPA: sugar phosphorylase [Desulfobacteraceae bacterium]|nr:sugar phosphorylase [Deltaproteobacteria bacterium]MBW2356169.1 sugar phosphorylase [Deltaproteobacteria bacterium]HDI60933.1 sugar phosphorylase [Desulfobacteraceae bacterium]